MGSAGVTDWGGAAPVPHRPAPTLHSRAFGGLALQAGSSLSNPEQIRTNLNIAERCQALRPDREAARITPGQPKKRNLNTETSSLRSRRSTPHLTSPLEGGRDELGKGCWGEVGSCLRRNDGWGAQG